MDTPGTSKEIVRVTIFNQTYSVSTSGDPRETEELAQQVDELMSAIARHAGNLDSTRTAVLACLHLADKLRLAESQVEELRSKQDSHSGEYAAMLQRLIASLEELTV